MYSWICNQCCRNRDESRSLWHTAFPALSLQAWPKFRADTAPHLRHRDRQQIAQRISPVFFGILLHGPPRSRYSVAEYLLLWSSWHSAPHGLLRRHGILLEDTVTVTAGCGAEYLPLLRSSIKLNKCKKSRVETLSAQRLEDTVTVTAGCGAEYLPLLRSSIKLNECKKSRVGTLSAQRRCACRRSSPSRVDVRHDALQAGNCSNLKITSEIYQHYMTS